VTNHEGSDTQGRSNRIQTRTATIPQHFISDSKLNLYQLSNGVGKKRKKFPLFDDLLSNEKKRHQKWCQTGFGLERLRFPNILFQILNVLVEANRVV
jgi:hypothetical protein